MLVPDVVTYDVRPPSCRGASAYHPSTRMAALAMSAATFTVFLVCTSVLPTIAALVGGDDAQVRGGEHRRLPRARRGARRRRGVDGATEPVRAAVEGDLQRAAGGDRRAQREPDRVDLA